MLLRLKALTEFHFVRMNLTRGIDVEFFKIGFGSPLFYFCILHVWGPCNTEYKVHCCSYFRTHKYACIQYRSQACLTYLLIKPQLMICLLILERERQKDRETLRLESNISQLPPAYTSTGKHTHNLGYVVWPGIEPTTCWCMGQCSNQLSHSARANFIFIDFWTLNVVTMHFFTVIFMYIT